ncbi:MAG: helix-turn-helix domain-containing protein [Leadbetterella sp.]|nr:helix-turn-helix domain-containing protein [Leadbetterella sp.]
MNIDDIKIKPIVTPEDFEEAGQVIESLVDADMIEDEAQRTKALNLLEAITVLAIDYEKKNYPMPPLDPIEAIKQRMEMLNLNQKDIARYFGGENRVSEVLNKKRSLTLNMAKKLHKYFGIPAEVLLT